MLELGRNLVAVLQLGDGLAVGLSVVMLGRADAGLSLPLRRMAIAHQAPTTLLVGEPGMGGKECLDLADRP